MAVNGRRAGEVGVERGLRDSSPPVGLAELAGGGTGAGARDGMARLVANDALPRKGWLARGPEAGTAKRWEGTEQVLSWLGIGILEARLCLEAVGQGGTKGKGWVGWFWWCWPYQT